MKNNIPSIFLMLCALAVFGQGIHPVCSIDYPEYEPQIAFDTETATASTDSAAPKSLALEHCDAAELAAIKFTGVRLDNSPAFTLSDDAKMGFRTYKAPALQTMPSRQAETAITGGWPMPETPQVIYEGSLPESLDKQFYIIAGETYRNLDGRLYPIGDDDVARLIYERTRAENLYSTTSISLPQTTTISVGEIAIPTPVESSGVGTQALSEPDQPVVFSRISTDTSFRHPSPIQNESLYYWQGRWWDTEALMGGKTDFKFRCSLKFERKGRFATKAFFENANINAARMIRIRQLMRLDGYIMGWDGYVCEAIPFIDDCYDETDAKRLRDTLLRALVKSQHVK